MKIIFLMTLLLTLSNIDHLFAQSAPKFKQLGVQKNNWTTKDLIEPAALASILKNPKASQPLIFNIGMVDDIKGAQKVGASSEKDGLTKFKAALSKLSKNRSIVVYCGCCPFERCPIFAPL